MPAKDCPGPAFYFSARMFCVIKIGTGLLQKTRVGLQVKSKEPEMTIAG